MKLIYCIESLTNSGGTERVTVTKANWLSKQQGVEVYIVTLKESGQPFFLLDSAVHHIVLDVPNGDKRAYAAAMNAVIANIEPDVCIAVSGMAVETLYKLNDKSCKIIEFHYTKNFLVNFVRGIRHLRFKHLHIAKMYWLQWRLQQIAHHYDCMVGLTKRDVRLWGCPANMTYIYNPLSFRSVRKSTCENKKIIAVGSWTPAKGMDQLLEAFGSIAGRHPDWTVELYGEGQDESLLKDIIAKYDIACQVSLNPPCQEIGSKLIESSIYAFPSRSDGFGLVIIEAMECGLPTVAMDCECGPREIVTPDTGIVVPDKNVASFAAALECLMDDEPLRKDMGRCAAERVSRFYPDRIMPQWLQLFERLRGVKGHSLA